MVREEWHDEIDKQNAYYAIKSTQLSKKDDVEDSFEEDSFSEEEESLLKESPSPEKEG